jgi:hypothetical protein
MENTKLFALANVLGCELKEIGEERGEEVGQDNEDVSGNPDKRGAWKSLGILQGESNEL